MLCWCRPLGFDTLRYSTGASDAQRALACTRRGALSRGLLALGEQADYTVRHGLGVAVRPRAPGGPRRKGLAGDSPFDHAHAVRGVLPRVLPSHERRTGLSNALSQSIVAEQRDHLIRCGLRIIRDE